MKPLSIDNMSYHPSKYHPRPLGSVRKTTSSIDSVPKFPPLTPVLDKHLYQGIAGNAMQVPPGRRSSGLSEPEEKPIVVRSSVTVSNPKKQHPNSSKSITSDSASSGKSDTKSKELKEAMAREFQLKQQIMQLQKVIDDLRMQVKQKEKVIKDLQEQFQRQEEHYKELYEKEKQAHQETKDQWKTTQQELLAAEVTISDLKFHHEMEVTQLKESMEQKLKDITDEKDKEIAIRDKKLNNLKNQMADALKGNSWERQQQLDELTKELHHVQDEADNLRFKIKSLQKSKGAVGSCDKCETMKEQLKTTQAAIKERDNFISNLEKEMKQKK